MAIEAEACWIIFATKEGNTAGQIHPLEWLDVLGATLQTVLPETDGAMPFERLERFQTGPQLSCID